MYDTEKHLILATHLTALTVYLLPSEQVLTISHKIFFHFLPILFHSVVRLHLSSVAATTENPLKILRKHLKANQGKINVDKMGKQSLLSPVSFLRL